MFRTGHRTAVLAASLMASLALVSLSPRLQANLGARAAACEFDKVDRIVAVGDVHGAYEQFVQILKAAGVIDRRNRWAGGKTHLVQTGDVLDRGAHSMKVVEFLRRLGREAERAGGKVHALIGNHEAMRMLGDFRYVDRGEYAAFTTPDSVETRRLVIENAPAAERARLERETPLGMIEMIRAFGPTGEVGSYMRTLNAVVKINGVVFLHGGISPATAAMNCASINEAIRRELGSEIEKTQQAPRTSLSAGEDGPLWYRGLANEPDTFAPEVEKILAAQGARAIVVGHSAEPGPIRSRFNRTVFLIDTGMQPAYLSNGRASALEIRGDVFTAIYKDSRHVIAGGVLTGGAP